jgi:hypothetical protein
MVAEPRRRAASPPGSGHWLLFDTRMNSWQTWVSDWFLPLLPALDGKKYMSRLNIVAGPFTFVGRLETTAAPKTCAAFLRRLPFVGQIVHVRWSGEGVWIPLGDYDFEVGYENHTSYPAPGQIILYPGGISETEILLAYGGVCFASKVGQLAGNHFITLTEGLDRLYDLGRMVLWEGAKDIRFELAQD